jgi:transposase
VNRWKKEALETLPEAFGSKKDSTIKEMESERDHLFQQIGKLQVEVDWLKKTQSI